MGAKYLKNSAISKRILKNIRNFSSLNFFNNPFSTFSDFSFLPVLQFSYSKFCHLSSRFLALLNLHFAFSPLGITLASKYFSFFSFVIKQFKYLPRETLYLCIVLATTKTVKYGNFSKNSCISYYDRFTSVRQLQVPI